MLAAQPTTGSSRRTQPAARARADGTTRPAAVRDSPTVPRTDVSGVAGVVTIGNCTCLT